MDNETLQKFFIGCWFLNNVYGEESISIEAVGDYESIEMLAKVRGYGPECIDNITLWDEEFHDEIMVKVLDFLFKHTTNV